jgi:hypothetical protein
VEPWESVHFELEEITEAADDRVFFGGSSPRAARAAAWIPKSHGWSVIWIMNGKVTRRRVSLDRDEALEAAGLSE